MEGEMTHPTKAAAAQQDQQQPQSMDPHTPAGDGDDTASATNKKSNGRVSETGLVPVPAIQYDKERVPSGQEDCRADFSAGVCVP